MFFSASQIKDTYLDFKGHFVTKGINIKSRKKSSESYSKFETTGSKDGTLKIASEVDPHLLLQKHQEVDIVLPNVEGDLPTQRTVRFSSNATFGTINYTTTAPTEIRSTRVMDVNAGPLEQPLV